MSITIPTSGEAITNTSLENLHEEARTVVNAIDPTNVGRSSINDVQLGTATLVQKSGVGLSGGVSLYISDRVSTYNSTTSARGLVYSSAAELYTEVSSWPTIETVTFNSFTPKNNSPMIIQFNCRVAGFTDVASSYTPIAVPNASFMMFFAIQVERTTGGSADNFIIEESVVGVHLQESLTYKTETSGTTVSRFGSGSYHSSALEHAVANAAMHLASSSSTYTSIKIKGALCPCYGAASTAWTANITNSFASMLLLEPGV